MSDTKGDSFVMGKRKRKFVRPAACISLAAVTLLAGTPGLAYGASTDTAANTQTEAAAKQAPAARSSWDEWLKKLAAYSAISSEFQKYAASRDSIKGDILIKETGDSAYSTESDAGYPVKEGKSYTLGLKLDVTGIKKDLNDIKDAVSNNAAVKDYFGYMGNGGLDVVGVRNLTSKLEADVTIPEGLDVSGEEFQQALSQLQLGDNFGPYTSNAKVHVDNTDVKDYDLSGYKFAVTSAAYDESARKVHIVMELQTPKNYNGKSYDEVSQFNFACLYAVVEAMPDTYTLELPGLQADSSKKLGKMTIRGSMGDNTSQSNCYMSANLTYSSGLSFRSNWYATQLEGGQDALQADGISLTAVRKAALTYQANGGTGTMDSTEGLLGESVKAADNQFTRAGYTFSGWNTKSDGSGTTVASGAEVPMDTEAVTLYAQWKKQQTPVEEHTITFHPNNGEAVFTQTAPNGGKAVKPENPARKGYQFAGWYADSGLKKAYNFSAPVTGNLDLYAKWKKTSAPAKPVKKVSGVLLPKVIAYGRHKQVLTWTGLTNVDGYYVYTNHCDEAKKPHPFRKVADYKASRKRVYTVTNLKTYHHYKYYVAAYRIVNGKKKIVKNSVTVHSVCGNTNARYTNVKKVRVNKTSVTLKKGKSYRIGAIIHKHHSRRPILDKTHCGAVRFLSRDSKIASVDYAKGIVKARKPGKTTIYVLGVNGVRTKVSVTVK